MKKIISSVFFGVVVSALVATSAYAQVSVGASGSGSGSAAGVDTSGPAVIVGPGMPAPTPIQSGGFVQFNNLTVETVSSASVPAEIVASGGPVAIPMANGTSGGASGAPGSMTTPSQATCFSFSSGSGSNGVRVACPAPSVTTSSGTNVITPGSIAPQPMPPIYIGSYRIEITASTELMLRDRTPAQLSSFTPGDQINVYGYYNTDGSIQAYLVRDTSKPVVTETMQLNNVTLNSISGTSIPATLTVTQTAGGPCYQYMGATPTAIACPLGVTSFSANSATANVTALPSLAPNWMMLRKYVVSVDAQTIVLDRNRTQLSLSSFHLGDSLNIYGESSDNGQTINADIIRDVSIPATASTFTGNVTAVNADGSFVIQTGNGQTLTVQNPVTVGESVTVRGLLNAASSTITAVTQVTSSNGGVINY